MNIFQNLLNFDHNVSLTFFSYRNIFLDRFFLSLTILGSWYIIGGLFIIASIIFLLRKKKRLIIPFFICLLGTGVMTVAIKFLVGRNRPSGNLALYVEKLPSFPSAHAALILAFIGFLVYCVWHFRIKLYNKIIISILSFLLVILVGLSRIYLGVHFFTDIICGYLVGVLWIVISTYLFRENFRLLRNNRS